MEEIREISDYKKLYNNKIKQLVLNKIPDLNKENSKTIKDYVQDMEKGIYISKSSKKGARSYTRLNALITKLVFLAKMFQKKFKKNLTELNENDLHTLFNDMRAGRIRKLNGEIYKSVADYVKDYKSFYHYYMKIQRNKDIDIKDITTDLDTKRDKPKWVYLNEGEFKQLVNQANFKYQVLMWFLYDTGIRTPKECFNTKVSDFLNDYKELSIRQEISKTFKRRIKLMLCNGLIKEYIKQEKLKPTDFLFNFSPIVATRYIKRIAEKVFGDKTSLAGKKYKDIRLYDFRHSSCCYWLPRYKSRSALLYRFGWRKEEEIHYYSEFLGMKDTISEEDLLIDLTKTEIEKQLIKAQQERDLLKEENSDIIKQYEKMNKSVKQIKEMLRHRKKK